MLQSMELQRFGHDRATEQRLPPPEKNESHGAGELHFPTKEKTMKTHFCCEVVKEKTPVSAEEPPSASGRSSAFSLASGTGALSAAGSLTQSEFSIRNKPDGLSQFLGLIKSLFSLPRLKASWRRWLLEGSGLTPSPPVLPWDPGGAPFPCPLPSAPHISRPAA